MSFAYGDLAYINSNGTRSGFLMIMSELLLAGKNTVARLLVLIVSMGYGVVKFVNCVSKLLKANI